MTATLRGTKSTRRISELRRTWTMCRDPAVFRGSIVEGRRAHALLAREPPRSLYVWGDPIVGVLETTTLELWAFLSSSELAPEGRFFAVAPDESFTLEGERAMGRVTLSVWLA